MLLSKKYTIIKLLFLFLAVIISFSVKAQVVRTVTVTNNNQISTIQIYEYSSVDAQPQFPGGSMAMMRFINHERKYPVEAYRNGIEGRVVCGFIVNVDGTISNISILKSVEESLDREAMRIIASMPPWITGLIDETPVPVFCTLAIPFRH